MERPRVNAEEFRPFDISIDAEVNRPRLVCTTCHTEALLPADVVSVATILLAADSHLADHIECRECSVTLDGGDGSIYCTVDKSPLCITHRGIICMGEAHEACER